MDSSGTVPIEFKPAFEGGLYVVRSDLSLLGVNTGDCLHTVDLINVFRRPLSEVPQFALFITGCIKCLTNGV